GFPNVKNGEDERSEGSMVTFQRRRSVKRRQRGERRRGEEDFGSSSVKKKMKILNT
ncbi:hypothetical protein Csa_010212, partial [Cucumis sativus]